MTRDENRLVRHLCIAVAVKLLLLGALWWLFVRDQRVDAGSEQTAVHLAAPTATPRPNPGVPR